MHQDGAKFDESSNKRLGTTRKIMRFVDDRLLANIDHFSNVKVKDLVEKINGKKTWKWKKLGKVSVGQSNALRNEGGDHSFS